MAKPSVFKEGESWKTGSSQKREGVAAYLEWLLTPEAERTPSSKRQLAEHLGVTTQTLRNWAKDVWLQRELANRGRTLFRVERAADVLESLFNQARDEDNPRSVQAAKVLLDYVDRGTESGPAEDLQEMSDEDLAQVALEILQRLAR